jgi:hypothetical protein
MPTILGYKATSALVSPPSSRISIGISKDTGFSGCGHVPILGAFCFMLLLLSVKVYNSQNILATTQKTYEGPTVPCHINLLFYFW